MQKGSTCMLDIRRNEWTRLNTKIWITCELSLGNDDLLDVEVNVVCIH